MKSFRFGALRANEMLLWGKEEEGWHKAQLFFSDIRQGSSRIFVVCVCWGKGGGSERGEGRERERMTLEKWGGGRGGEGRGSE